MLLLGAWPLSSGAQTQVPDSTLAAPAMIVHRSIDGRVVRAKGGGLVPVPGLTVTLHRVGPEGGRPLDSTHTTAGGHYRFRYDAFGSDEAVYLVSVGWSGITYFSTPTRAPDVGNGDADITVFDTTSKPVTIHTVGHHLVIAAPLPNGDREVAEVFELGNDSSVTRIAPPGGATFTGHLVAGAKGAHVTEGDIAATTVHIDGDQVSVDAPLSPGIRQLAVQYTLPPSAFPLTIPIESPTAAFEVLVEEPATVVQAPNLKKMQSVALEGRTFSRYLAQDLQSDAVVTIAAGAAPTRDWTKWYIVLGVVAGLAMIAALVFAFRGRGRARVTTSNALPAESSEPSADDLVRRIAELDAAHERGAFSGDGLAEYERERAALKAELAARLAATRGQG